MRFTSAIFRVTNLELRNKIVYYNFKHSHNGSIALGLRNNQETNVGSDSSDAHLGLLSTNTETNTDADTDT
jgi:hypothetical protein